MLAKRVDELPAKGDWIFEPKWDGFRALVFRDGDEIFIQSRDEKPLNRYFPELLEPLRAALPARCVLDGEMVIVKNDGLDFGALQLRLHPAASRVKLLSGQNPASFVFFDLLCLGDRDLCGEAFQERRHQLESLLDLAAPPIHLTPATTDRGIAADWFRRFEGAGLDGVMAKDPAGTYAPNKRMMLKVKHERDCDCVVAGFRWHKKGEHTMVGSLLLGLFDDAGALQHVGVTASFSTAKQKELVEFLQPYRKDALMNHPWKAWADYATENDVGVKRMPGGQSRWSQGKDLSWEPLRPELIVEVATTTCREIASGTRRNSADGDRTKSQAIVHTPSLKLSLRRNWRQFFRREGKPYSFFFFQRSRHSRVGSSSGSGFSCGVRRSSGT
jgi:ATP-dependent DNA ligase